MRTAETRGSGSTYHVTLANEVREIHSAVAARPPPPPRTGSATGSRVPSWRELDESPVTALIQEATNVDGQSIRFL